VRRIAAFEPSKFGRILAVGALVAVGLTLVGPATAGAGTSGASTTRVCALYRSTDWNWSPITENDSLAQIRTKDARNQQRERAFAAASTGRLHVEAEAQLRVGDRYRAHLIAAWRSAGDGHALSRVAARQGYATTVQYVNSLAFKNADTPIAQRRWKNDLASICGGLRPITTSKPRPSNIPDGRILAVKLGTGQIHGFTPAGTDLGAIRISGVTSPITWMTLSPDHSKLAFDAGRKKNFKLWVINLAADTFHKQTGVTCMDWDDDSVHFWGPVGPATSRFIARLSPDGTYEPASRINVDACPASYSAAALVAPLAAADGDPPQINIVPKDGSAPTPITSTACTMIEPHLSPNGHSILITVGCGDYTASGVYVANADGTDLHQIVAGVTAAATWSPDSRWITFAAYDPKHPGDTARVRVVIASADGRERSVVTPSGYSWPVWAPKLLPQPVLTNFGG
jgi:Tol biopolymer transport system component